jgi:acetyl esterase/lipase
MTDLASRLDDEHLSVYRAMPADMLAHLEDFPTARAQMAAVAAKVKRPAPPEGLTTEDCMVPGAEGDPDVMVRLYRPAGLPTGSPALYWVHGGGMVMGDVAMNDDSCAAIAEELQILVASVEYRLAPEFPFPAPIEDCYAGLRWFAGTADELGIDRDRIAIGGASAGGGLCAGLALVARDRGEVHPVFQLLVYPMIDDRNANTTSPASDDPKVWNRYANAVGWDAYLAGRAGADDVSPYAAPARATDLAGLPPAYINVGDLDLFLDEDVAYAMALTKAGVPTELHVYPGAFHGSANFASRAALSRRWNQEERAALGRALHGPGFTPTRRA